MMIASRLEQPVARAKADLAGRLDIEIDAIETLEARFVTWPNGAIGCPKPDMMYTQALVPGYRILLRTESGTHAYHGAREADPFYCPPELVTEPLPDSDVSR